MTRAAIYTRISKDDEGKAAGVRRQETDCRKLAKAKGWEVADVLCDNDVSAFDGRARPGYDQLLDGLREGDYDALVAWKLVRLTRGGVRGLTPLLDALDGRPVMLVQDSIDTSSAMGEGVAAMLASVARTESENIGKRVARKKEELAAEGKPSGGRRAFGYEPDGITVRKGEAKAYRKAARDVLAGKSLRAVAREWNDAGLRTPQRDQLWSQTVLRWVLTNPRHAGLRAHKGKVVGDAVWPGIIDRGTHEALVARFASNGGAMPRRRSLLTGLVRCECGTPMVRDGRNWRCRPDYRHPKACGHVYVTAEGLEVAVEEMVVELLGSPKLRRRLSRRRDDGADDAAMEVSKSEAKLDELADLYANDKISEREWMRTRKTVEKRLADARGRLARRNGTHALERFRGAGSPAKMYERIDMDERRAVISALLEHVVLYPAKGRTSKLDLDRLDPKWKA
jgi:DNA invertase Pin-like site-specific DNA recombinase